MSHIHDYIVNYQPRDYGGVDLTGCELDCSLGVSFESLPPEIMRRLGQILEPEIRHYPHNAALLAENGNRLLTRYAQVPTA